MTSENLVTAQEGITLEEAKVILGKARKEKLPIVDKDFNLKGLITIKDIEKQIKYPLAAKDAQGRLLCGAGIGITANVLESKSTGGCACRCTGSGFLSWSFFCKCDPLPAYAEGSISRCSGYCR